MMQFLRRHKNAFFLGTIVIFLIGTFVGLGGYLFTSNDVSDAVAVVGPTKISYQKFSRRVTQYVEAVRANKKVELTDAQISEIKAAMLRDMIVDEILFQEAEKVGLRVTDRELAAAIQHVPSFQRDGVFDQNLYFQALRYSLRITPEEFERDERKALLAARLKQMLIQSAKLLPAEVMDEYVRVKGSAKDFDKKKDQFAQELQQNRALDTINSYLRQVTANMEIRSYLDQRERGT